jgi:hypothetical protein
MLLLSYWNFPRGGKSCPSNKGPVSDGYPAQLFPLMHSCMVRLIREDDFMIKKTAATASLTTRYDG